MNVTPRREVEYLAADRPNPERTRLQNFIEQAIPIFDAGQEDPLWASTSRQRELPQDKTPEFLTAMPATEMARLETPQTLSEHHESLFGPATPAAKLSYPGKGESASRKG
jgi:hypothetical protein